MITGNSYLRSGHHIGHLGFRAGGSNVDDWAVDHNGCNDRTVFARRLLAPPGRTITDVVRPLPMRTLDPGVFDDSSDDDYASRALTATSLDEVYERVIAAAELRCGRAVVRDVLVALSQGDGCTSVELSAGDGDRAVSIAHVLAILGNHLHRTDQRFRLSPHLRSAVYRRFPLGSPASRECAVSEAGLRNALPMVHSERGRAFPTWRERT